MFEVSMAVLAAILGIAVGAVVYRTVGGRRAAIFWAGVDFCWVLALIVTVGDKVVGLDRSFAHADRAAQAEALAGDQAGIRLQAFFAERKACPYLASASAVGQPLALCQALAETEFESSRAHFTKADALRLQNRVIAADPTGQARDLQWRLGNYAQHSAAVTPATSTPYDGPIEQHLDYFRYLLVVLIFFGLRIGRSTADILRALGFKAATERAQAASATQQARG